MFDVLAFPVPPSRPVEARLRMPLGVGARDEAEFVCLGWTTHLCRQRRCGWHLVLHRDRDGGCWTHLYRVMAEAGGGTAVLLDRALPGDERRRLRDEACSKGPHSKEAPSKGAGTASTPLPPSDPRLGLRG